MHAICDHHGNISKTEKYKNKSKWKQEQNCNINTSDQASLEEIYVVAFHFGNTAAK